MNKTNEKTKAELLVIEKLRKINSKAQFKGLRCSDGLPCTAYTCNQDWCKFPERKIEAQIISQEQKEKDEIG